MCESKGSIKLARELLKEMKDSYEVASGFYTDSYTYEELVKSADLAYILCDHELTKIDNSNKYN